MAACQSRGQGEISLNSSSEDASSRLTFSQKKSLQIGLALVLGIIGYLGSSPYLNTQQSILTATLVFLVVLWTNEGLPLGVVSLLPVILFPTLGIIGTKETCSAYSKPILFLFLGGFYMGLAIEKIDLHKALIDRMFRVFPYTPRGIIASLAITSALLSCLLSNTTTTLLLMPLALHATQVEGLRRACVLAVAYGATIGGIITPVGTPPNLILLGFLESSGIEGISFAKWMMATTPLAFIMLLFLTFWLSRGCLHLKVQRDFSRAVEPLTHPQKKLFILLALAATLLLANSPIEPYYPGLGLNEKLLLLSFGLILFAPGLNFLQWSDTRRTPYEILFLFGAGFAIANAIGMTGLDSRIAGALSSIPLVSLVGWTLVIATFVTFSTELTSNMALTTVALPILLQLCQNVGLPVPLVLMVTAICASYAFMLPIATAPNAIAMASGYLKVSHMARAGLVLNIVGILLTTLIATTYWKSFFGF